MIAQINKKNTHPKKRNNAKMKLSKTAWWLNQFKKMH